MIVGFIIKFVGTIMDLLLPWILAYIIDEVVPKGNIISVLWWGAAMIFCAFIAVLGNVIANRMASAVARDSIRVVRNDLFTKIMQLSCNQVDTCTESSLISRMTSDTYNIHQVMSSMQRLGVRAPILLIGGIAVTLTLDPVLSAILIATLPFLGVVVFYVAKKGIPLYQIHQKASDHLIGKVRESITGIRVIKALSKENYERDRFEEINQTVVDKEKKAGITMAVTSPVMNFLLNMGWVMIILVGAYRVNLGLTAPGKIIAFLTYFTIILNAMLSITRLFVMFSKAGSSAERIDKVLQLEKALESIQGLAEDNNDAMVSYQNVTFSYNRRKNNLENITFSLKRGNALGIIGATGSGKSTLVNLLMRFYDVNSGRILVKGKDIRSYPLEDLRSMFGTVFQNDMLFEDTIRENIKLGRSISDEAMKKAADCALIGSFIEEQPDGYDTYLAIKGNNLSGGQKQRVLIARALASRPEILILDDSSSALDYKTDAMIRNNIKDMLGDTTVIIIAQRVSSVMNCDQILVLDDGEIIGNGTHEELLKCCDEYAKIAELQLNS
jgi:ATP-binding cassette subfamily B protein